LPPLPLGFPVKKIRFNAEIFKFKTLRIKAYSQIFINSMFKVYSLYSKRFDKLCIAYTNSFRQRIASHILFGKHYWTRSYRPLILIHLEEFSSKQEAMKREKELKAWKGREFLRKEILPVYL